VASGYGPARASGPAPATTDANATAAAAKKPASTPASTPASSAKDAAEQVLEAAENSASSKKRLTLVVNGKEKKYITLQAGEEGSSGPSKSSTRAAPAGHSTPAPAAVQRPAAPVVNPLTSRQYYRARAAATVGHGSPKAAAGAAGHGGEAHWSYEGETGPQAWGQMKPEFNLCAIGKRQSPIHIDERDTLQGPAEPLLFNYQPSDGSVVNNGHTIQVDVQGDNTLTVRGSVYKLLQFHFHTPSEERVNSRGFAMVAHLVHRNAEGQLAVVALLMDPGSANSLINKVWTYMPLDSGDRVRMPENLLDLNELLPKDQRYYQFMGSLTTPPCTEGVLWNVIKQPISVGRDQIRLFSQLFSNNARPIQAINGRPVRSAQ
jgi:carbonic anhydrase